MAAAATLRQRTVARMTASKATLRARKGGGQGKQDTRNVNGDMEMADQTPTGTAAGDGWQLPYGIIPHAAVAAAVDTMLEALITCPSLPAVFAPARGAVSLPPALTRLPLPLVSLMSVSHFIESEEDIAAPLQPPSPSGGAAGTADSLAAGAKTEALRTEFAALLETLLDFRTAYDSVYDERGGRVGSCGAGTGGSGGAAAAAVPFGRRHAERSVLLALLQRLQCAYGATLRESDRAILRVLLRLDELLLPPPPSGQEIPGASDNVDAGGCGHVVHQEPFVILWVCDSEHVRTS